MEIGAWLRELGLSQHEAAFVANAIDWDVLQELTEADFEKMGIPLGDRERSARCPPALLRTRMPRITRRVLNAATSR